MSNKDFLSQFSNTNKPDSFREEERIKISKPKKPVNVKLLVIILCSILVIAGLVLFLIFRPTIEVKNFVGLNATDAKAWIKQNDIETQGIVFSEEYNFDYDEGYIISQSIPEGKKVRKDVKMNFVVSKGADPDEIIKVPDIESMTKEELQDWIKENKLTKTKVMSAYHEEKEIGEVISYDFKGGDADSFTRSSTLTITVSKGPQPAGVVVVNDFVGKHYSEVESWAKSNKVEINKTESYSDKTEKDYVISQSIEAKKEIKEGDTLTVVVSLGKAVYAKDFVGKSIEELTHWATKNGVYVVQDEVYDDDYNAGYIISQEIAEGKIIEDEFKVEASLGNPKLPKELNTMSYQELKDWIAEVNEKGADISKASHTEENSDTVPVGNMISIGGQTSEVRTGSKLKPVVSLGKNIWVKLSYKDEDGTEYFWADVLEKNEDYARKICDLAGITYEVKYKTSSEIDAHKVISVIRENGTSSINGQEYISEAETITVTISTGE